MLLELSIIALLLAYITYKYSTKTFNHWSNAGVAHLKPYPGVGNTASFVLQTESFMDFVVRVYNAFPDKRYFGIYMFREPILVFRDPELIRKILIKDFDHFANRNQSMDPEMEPIFAKNLLNLRDQKWKTSRSILSPTFTASKMKSMFHLIDDIGGQLSKYLQKKIDQESKNGVLKMEIKDLFTRFTNDVIATSAFGIQVDSLKEPENEFYVMGKKTTTFGFYNFLISLLWTLMPAIMKKLKVTFLGAKVSNFYKNLILGTVKERDEKKIVRPDLLNLLMEAREKQSSDEGLTDDEIIAQSVLFFFAGFETVSTNLSFTAHELALNPDVQARLQEEIDSVMEEDGGKLTYDGIMNKMKYLDQVVSESLRKWPPAPAVDRSVSKTYILEPEQDGEREVVLNKNSLVWIPVSAFHLNPKYFPNPQAFDPDRFSEENKHKIIPFTYMPFGMGPRNCIGMRFALMEVKLCLVHILRHFSLVPTEQTQIPLKLAKKPNMISEKGFHLGLKKRNCVNEN